MPGAMRCSRLLALLGKMILTRRTSMQHPKPKLRRSDRRSQSTGDAAVAAPARDGAKLRVRSGGPVLTSDQSAILRERLLGQLVAINSTDEAAAWARQNLSAKNTLTAGDARMVEEEFQRRVSNIGDGEDPSKPSNAVSVRNVMPAGPPDAGDSQKISKVTGKRP